MFNLRFKNPYRSDEASLSENEVNIIPNLPKFLFKDTNGIQILSICEFDQIKILAPKGKYLIIYYFS
jgi:hypothetical protein